MKKQKRVVGEVYIAIGRNTQKVVAVGEKNTYENKEKLKEAGYKWDASQKEWIKEVKIDMTDIDPKSKEDNLKVAKRAVEILRELQKPEFINLIADEQRTKKIIEFADNH